MKRGEKAFDRLKELALYKMSLPENVAKGWPDIKEVPGGFSNVFSAVTNHLRDEIKEMDVEIFSVFQCFYVSMPAIPKDILQKLKYEIADVAAYCAILLDVIEQKEKYEA